jgi:quercetin dioxygenase-like cupin family protein
MEEGYRVGHLEPVNPNDPKGSTWEWKHEDGRQITVYERHAGHKFGGHYHTGSDPSKCPERLYVARGRISVIFDDSGVIGGVVLNQGDTLIIDPLVKHWMRAIDDCTLIEYRITLFDRENPDTVPIE